MARLTRFSSFLWGNLRRGFGPVLCQDNLDSDNNGVSTSSESQQPPKPEVHDPYAPIQFEQFSKEWTQMSSQDNFDGFRLEAHKPVTPIMAATHSLVLGTAARECGYVYQFGPTFALENGSLVVVGRYGNDGTMTARGIKRFGKSVEARISSSSSLQMEQRNMLELSVDKSGSDWAGAVKAAWQGTWILNSSFSQLVAPDLHLGCDLTWIAANSASPGSIGLRYNLGASHIISAMVSRQPNFKSPTGLTENVHSAKMQYFRKVSERLSLGTELEISQEPPSWDSALRVGYEYLFRQARIQGLIDFGGRVSMTAQTATGFGVSGAIDYWRGDYKFGFMMQLLPPNPEGGEAGAPPM